MNSSGKISPQRSPKQRRGSKILSVSKGGKKNAAALRGSALHGSSSSYLPENDDSILLTARLNKSNRGHPTLSINQSQLKEHGQQMTRDRFLDIHDSSRQSNYLEELPLIDFVNIYSPVFRKAQI